MRTQIMHDPAVAAPWLEPLSAGESVEKTQLDSFPFKIGRMDTADLSIDSTRVSREHAVITRQGKKYRLHDLGSTNGTFLNGQRIQEAVLSDGDQVMFAEIEFVFYSGAPEVERDTATQLIPEAQSAGNDSTWQRILSVRRIHEAVTRRGVRIVYQPIIDLDTGNHFGYEALATNGDGGVAQPRCEHWTGGVESRAAARLRGLCRRLATEGAVELPEGRLLVALASTEIDRPMLVQQVCQLRDLLSPEHQVVVEIPDGVVRDETGFREMRAAMRNADIEVAYDGYASGRSQVTDQKEIAPDYLKLAPSLMRSLRRSPDRQRQVQLVTHACHDVGTLVIATGIDDEADLDVCHHLKCDLVQGELFGHPQPAAALVQLPQSSHKTAKPLARG